MLLPWYQETGNAIVDGKLASLADSKNAFQVYSFVEASIFLVALGVLALLFARGERKAFHLPGGDGTVDPRRRPVGDVPRLLPPARQARRAQRGTRSRPPWASSGGSSWPSCWARCWPTPGFRIRAAHIAEPAADDVPPMPSRPPEPPPEARAGASGETAGAPTTRPAARSRRAGHVDVAATDQLSFDDPGAPPPGAAERDGEEDPATAVPWEEPRVTRRRQDPEDVFERPADPDDPTEFRPGRRRR